MAIGRAQPDWSLALARAEEGTGQGKGQGRSGKADGASMAWTATAGPASRARGVCACWARLERAVAGRARARSGTLSKGGQSESATIPGWFW